METYGHGFEVLNAPYCCLRCGGRSWNQICLGCRPDQTDLGNPDLGFVNYYPEPPTEDL